MNTNRGFTLIELMVTLAIVGILVGVAYPSYRSHVLKTQRGDAKIALTQLQLAQDKLRGNCRYYAGDIAASDFCSNDATKTGAENAALSRVAYTTGTGNSPDGFYTIAITANSASGVAYTATATALGAQLDDTGCTVLTLTVNNTNPQGNLTPDACW